jgi:hypothetical protein
VAGAVLRPERGGEEEGDRGWEGRGGGEDEDGGARQDDSRMVDAGMVAEEGGGETVRPLDEVGATEPLEREAAGHLEAAIMLPNDEAASQVAGTDAEGADDAAREPVPRGGAEAGTTDSAVGDAGGRACPNADGFVDGTAGGVMPDHDAAGEAPDEVVEGDATADQRSGTAVVASEDGLVFRAAFLNCSSVKGRSPWLRQMVNEGMDVVALAETWLRQDQIPCLSALTWVVAGLSGFSGRAHGGVALGITPRWAEHMTQLRTKEGLLPAEAVWVRLGAPPASILLGVVYSAKELPAGFAADIQEAVTELRMLDEAVLIMGDFNARLGPASGDRTKNAGGRRLEALCVATGLNRMALKGKYVPTYEVQRGKRLCRSTPDHILEAGFEQTSITVGPSLGIEHRPLLFEGSCTVRKGEAAPPPTRRSGPRGHLAWKTEKASAEQWEAFSGEVEALLGGLPDDGPSRDSAGYLVRVLSEAGRAHIGLRFVRPSHRNWWGPLLARQLKEKLAARGGSQEKEARAAFRSAVRGAKRAAVLGMRIERPREVYALLRRLGGDTNSHKEGSIPMMRWVEAFGAVGREAPEETHLFGPRLLISWAEEPTCALMTAPDISTEEVQTALRECAANASAGPDRIPVRFLCRGGPALWKHMAAMYTRLLRGVDPFPEEWWTSLLVPLYKGKGDVNVAGSYRPIAMGSGLVRVMARVLDARIKEHLEAHGLLCEEQGGFRRHRSTTESIVTLLAILARRRSEKLTTHVAFIDIQKAYDSVDRPTLWARLRAVGLDEATLACIMRMYSHVRFKLVLNGEDGPEFEVERGVRQGCPLSPTLFLAFINGVIQELRDSGDAVKVALGIEVAALFWADDVVILAADEERLQRQLDRLVKSLNVLRLRASTSKTVAMVIKRHPNARVKEPPVVRVRIYGEEIKQVSSFEYLGATISEDLSAELFYRKRVASGLMATIHLSRLACRAGGLPAWFRRNMWNMFGRPKMEYAVAAYPSISNELAHDLDVVQWRHGGSIMGLTSGQVPHAAVMGDLDLVPLSARFNELSLRFWGRVACAPATSLMRKVIVANRLRAAHTGHEMAGEWSAGIMRLLKKYGLDEYKDLARIAALGIAWWKDWVRVAVRRQVQTEWGRLMVRRTGLALLRPLKMAMRFEEYLILATPAGARVMAQLRAGMYPTASLYLGWKKPAHPFDGSGACLCCRPASEQAVDATAAPQETITHFLRDCPCQPLADLRLEFQLRMHQIIPPPLWGLVGTREWHFLLGVRMEHLPPDIQIEVLRVAGDFARRLHTARIGVLRALCGQPERTGAGGAGARLE